MKLLKRIQYNSAVVLTFSLISFVALILGLVSGGAVTQAWFSVYNAPLSEFGTWVRFFTHVLGHANYEHFIGNILLILVVGPPLEERYGSVVTLLAMLITALVSGWAVWLIFPNKAVLGASGVVFMFIMLASFGGMKKGRIPLTMILVAVLYLGGEIVTGILQDDNISQLTHVLGGVCGGCLGFILRGREVKKPGIESISPTDIHSRAVSDINTEIRSSPVYRAPQTQEDKASDV